MIVAIILADRLEPLIHGQAPYFLPVSGDGDIEDEEDGETVLERLTRTVLRGPFGGTIVAAAPEHEARIKELLSGFAVQHLKLSPARAHVSEALMFAEAFRARWQKAMAAAAQRFPVIEESDDEEEEAEASPKGKKAVRRPQAKGKPAPQEWSKHHKSADVKIRGLARSFERDGVILFRGEQPISRPDLQAQVVEAFGREGAEKAGAARPMAQAVYQSVRGYPVLLSVDAAKEAAALPRATDFDDWLLQQLKRVQDVSVDDPAAIQRIHL